MSLWCGPLLFSFLAVVFFFRGFPIVFFPLVLATKQKAGVDYLLAHPETGIVFADSVFTEADGTHLERTRPVPPFNYIDFITKCENPISQPSSFIRREVIKKLHQQPCALAILRTVFYLFFFGGFTTDKATPNHSSLFSLSS